jgi:hypothetical protein
MVSKYYLGGFVLILNGLCLFLSKMKKPIYTLFLCLLTGLCMAQTGIYYAGGAGVRSIGNITSLFTNESALYHNLAGVGFDTKKFSFDVSGENLFGLQDYINPSLAFRYKKDKSHFVIGYNQNGIKEYKESSTFIGYARPLSNTLAIGARFNYHRYAILDYGSTSTMSADIGFFGKINKSLSISSYINHLSGSKIKEEYSLPTRFVIGLDYMPSDMVHLLFEVEKIQNFDLSPKIGVVYDIGKKLTLQTGFDFVRGMYGIGFKYAISQDNVHVNTGVGIHQQLGTIPSLSLQYSK